MTSSNFMRQIGSHLLALFLGVVLTFGSLKILSSQADPLLPTPSTDNSNNSVAVQPAITDTNANKVAHNFVGTAIAKTGPAVVRIDTQRTITRRADPFLEDPMLRDFFGDQFQGQVPRQRQQISGLGSGFIIDKSGIVLTNAHVVDRADRVTVTLKDGREFSGKVLGTDEITDLAVVKVDSKGANLPIANLGDSSQLAVGDWAIAVGNPIGLNNTVTLGIISTLERSSAQVGISDKRINFLQTDAAINPGNSGGPLLNEQGQVIGINTAIRADATGIGFAIPINKVKAIKDTLAAGKQVAHPYVGIQMITITPDLAKQNNQDPNSPIVIPEIEGVLVAKVLPNTPAERGGIRRGDVIIEVNQKRVTSADQVQQLVEDSGVNQSLKMKVQRGDRPVELNITTAQLEGMS
ncbi:MAG: HhoA/HhoB/HtrA family serine endopeptidase [Xenococcaceae cyanobacterium]